VLPWVLPLVLRLALLWVLPLVLRSVPPLALMLVLPSGSVLFVGKASNRTFVRCSPNSM